MRLIRRKHEDVGVWFDVAAGAVAGAFGTWLMSPAMKVASKVQPEVDQTQEQQVSWDENATVKTAKRLTRPLGIRLGDKKALAGTLVHWGYGISQGIALGLLSRALRKQPLGIGLLFGAALWFIGDEVMVPKLELAPKAEAFPPSTHAKALWTHLVYGGAAEGALRLSRRALA